MRSLEPMTCPPGTPAPAIANEKHAPQWSRPPTALIFGERPNSPMATTRVSSSSPRLDKSSMRVAKERSNWGHRTSRTRLALLACVSQRGFRPPRSCLPGANSPGPVGCPLRPTAAPAGGFDQIYGDRRPRGRRRVHVPIRKRVDWHRRVAVQRPSGVIGPKRQPLRCPHPDGIARQIAPGGCGALAVADPRLPVDGSALRFASEAEWGRSA